MTRPYYGRPPIVDGVRATLVLFLGMAIGMVNISPLQAVDPGQPEHDVPATRPVTAVVEVQRFVGHTKPTSGELSPDGKLLLSKGTREDETVRLWDVRSGQEIRQFKGGRLTPIDVAFSPDGRHVLGSNSDGRIRLWETDSGKLVRTFSGHRGGAFSILFLPGGKRFVSDGFDDRIVRVWNVETGRQVGQFTGHKGEVMSLALAPDGRHVLTSDIVSHYDVNLDEYLSTVTAILWDVQTQKEVRRLENLEEGATHFYFYPDGRRVISVGYGGGKMLVRDLETWQILYRREEKELPLGGVKFSPDGKRVLYTHDEQAILADAETFEEIARFGGRGRWEGSYGASFSPDGKHALTGGCDNVLRLWKLPD